MKKSLVFISLFCILSSCNYTFDVTSPLEKPIMRLECITGFETEDKPYTIFYLKQLSPIGKEIHYNFEYELESMSVKRNGQEVECLIREYPGVPDKYYYANIQGKTGDKIEFNCKAEGMDPISASTIVPSKPQFSASYQFLDEKNGWVSYIFEVQLNNHKIDPQIAVEVFYYSGGLNHSLYVKGIGETDTFLNYIPYKYLPANGDNSFNIVDEREIKDGRFVFQASIPSGNIDKVCFLRVYNLSDEAYKYYLSSFNNSQNSLSNWNLAPVTPIYSNVKAGNGILGALNYTEQKISLDRE